MLKKLGDEKIMAIRSLNSLIGKLNEGSVTDAQAKMLTELMGYLCRNDIKAKSGISEQRLKYLLDVKRNSEGQQPPVVSRSFGMEDVSFAAGIPWKNCGQHEERSTSVGSIQQEKPVEVLVEPNLKQGDGKKRGFWSSLNSRFNEWRNDTNTEKTGQSMLHTDETSALAPLLDPREDRRRELREKIAPRGNLLEETLQALLPGDTSNNAAGVLEHWSITLDAGECRALIKSFESLVGEGTARLHAWLELLRMHGLEPVDADQSHIVVTTENRGRYANGVVIPDGAEVAIVCHPWTFDGSVCCAGLLELPSENIT